MWQLRRCQEFSTSVASCLVVVRSFKSAAFRSGSVSFRYLAVWLRIAEAWNRISRSLIRQRSWTLPILNWLAFGCCPLSPLAFSWRLDCAFCAVALSAAFAGAALAELVQINAEPMSAARVLMQPLPDAIFHTLSIHM